MGSLEWGEIECIAEEWRSHQKLTFLVFPCEKATKAGIIHDACHFYLDLGITNLEEVAVVSYQLACLGWPWQEIAATLLEREIAIAHLYYRLGLKAPELLIQFNRIYPVTLII